MDKERQQHVVSNHSDCLRLFELMPTQPECDLIAFRKELILKLGRSEVEEAVARSVLTSDVLEEAWSNKRVGESLALFFEDVLRLIN